MCPAVEGDNTNQASCTDSTNPQARVGKELCTQKKGENLSDPHSAIFSIPFQGNEVAQPNNRESPVVMQVLLYRKLVLDQLLGCDGSWYGNEVFLGCRYKAPRICQDLQICRGTILP
jgi:hypothetical protein